MTPEEIQYWEDEKAKLQVAQQQQEAQNMQIDGQAFELREAEKSIISDQIELGQIKEEVENLLRGRILKEDEHGISRWAEPPNNEMKILSEHGVHLIMNTISFYLNKNTLLSNYDEDTIREKMIDFATDLSDTIFMEYEKVFEYPTEKEMQEKLKDRIAKKTQRRSFAYELIGKKVTDKERENITKGFIDDIENRIEEEMTKIGQQLIKDKLKRFLIIIRQVQDVVHSTYLRALGGAERRTLRQHIHVSEARGMSPMGMGGTQQRKSSIVNPFSWFRR